ncbi:MAG: hypothetical protein A2958_00250 [Candidatus Levybacteria bacterium RIFCSPLOWO2_01_FULL_38_13]|nr:MAG: hypothetical protein A2629_02335 [Candidatus Levybacteria bacterium RIFCSPHIGHO2_01_FULL_41_15]OGH34968.1 MAG: hypothetical protein A2958_00250 [Candidatus Levybacteria bacterium RIFCSPLOWO2_01_FULL_38_13]
MNKVFLSIFAIAFFALFAVSQKALADTVCQPIYGGGQTCVQVGNILVNKTVKNPQTGAFVDNLNINDPKLLPLSTVTFQITVTNTGSGNLSKITVKDTLPSFVTFVSGPGSFDRNTKVLTFEVSNLGAGQSQTFTLEAKTVEENKLPQDQGIVCVVNQVLATSDSNQSSDNSQFCIEKPVVAPVTKGGLKVFPAPTVVTTPPTGPEMLSLIGLIPAGGLGFLLRRKARK